MAIGFVEEKGQYFVVYDENSRKISEKWKSDREELLGYTATSFSVRDNQYIVVYDEHCRKISERWAG